LTFCNFSVHKIILFINNSSLAEMHCVPGNVLCRIHELKLDKLNTRELISEDMIS